MPPLWAATQNEQISEAAWLTVSVMQPSHEGLKDCKEG